MSSRLSTLPGSPLLSRWGPPLLAITAILLVDSVGPETYAGIHEDVISAGILVLFLAWMVGRRAVGRGSGIETDPETPATVGEHYRSTESDAAPGVYRVVGAGDSVTLLRVADVGGGREHTGELLRVDQATLDDVFEAAADPDAGVSVTGALRGIGSGLYWNVRKFF